MLRLFKKFNNLFDYKQEEKYLEEFIKDDEVKIYEKIRGVTGFLFFITFTMLFLTIANIYYTTKEKETTFIAMNKETKETFVLNTEREPVKSTLKMKRLMEKALLDIFDLNFISINQKKNTLRKYFLEDSWELFSNYFDNNIANFIKQNSLSSSLAFLDEPYLLKGFSVRGKDYWVLEAPVVVTYAGSLGVGRDKIYQSYYVEIIFQEVDKLDHPAGLLIKTLRMIPKK